MVPEGRDLRKLRDHEGTKNSEPRRHGDHEGHEGNTTGTRNLEPGTALLSSRPFPVPILISLTESGPVVVLVDVLRPVVALVALIRLAKVAVPDRIVAVAIAAVVETGVV